MRTLNWLLVVLLNLGIAAAFIPALFEGGASAKLLAIRGVVVLLFLAIGCFLIAARFNRAPSWAHCGMKMLCWAIPGLWLFGSLDHGMVSGLEFFLLLFAAAFGWGSWRAFLLFPPKLNLPHNVDAGDKAARAS